MIEFSQSNNEALIMSDWRNNPRTGKSTFMPLLNDIDARLKLGETLKQIYESFKDSKALEMSYPQFTRYVKKYCNGGQNVTTPKPKEKLKVNAQVNTSEGTPDETPHQITDDLLSQYMEVCYRQERIAKRAIEKGVPLEQIKEWNAPNKVRLGTLITNYEVKN